ncbi:hypothetical protein [Aquimarina sp. 2201CG14-23]|nr:hypothetical protein [Aquimarina sp. 2201CG14-23]MDH7445642.1 hypothetical protein [Aquimarina sp. 2201CG14-23]
MKQFLLPVMLICFTIFCLGFVHIDNMDKLEDIDKEVIVVEEPELNITS